MKEFLPIACEEVRKPEWSKGDGRLIRGCQLGSRHIREFGRVRLEENRDYHRINVFVNEIPPSIRRLKRIRQERTRDSTVTPSSSDGVRYYGGGGGYDSSARIRENEISEILSYAMGLRISILSDYSPLFRPFAVDHFPVFFPP